MAILVKFRKPDRDPFKRPIIGYSIVYGDGSDDGINDPWNPPCPDDWDEHWIYDITEE